MNIKINHDSKIPIYRQVAEQMRRMIFSGEMAEGSTLPSERATAKILGVHRNTIIKAYNELKAEELIESRQGVGYIVAMPQTAEKPGQRQGAHGEKGEKAKKVNWQAEINEKYLDMEITFDDLFQRFGDREKISMGSGISCPGIYDKKKLAEDIAAMVSEEGKTQYFYSPYKGDRILRQQLVSFLSAKGIKATSGEIQILSETNQALDFLVTLLVKPGDSVIMEEAVSPDAYRAMELAGAEIVTVPIDDEGIDCDALCRAVIQKKPRLIYVNSSFNDPTGAILPLARRKKIVEISNKYRIPIIEEDAASELVYSGAKLPPIKAFDRTGNVVYIYSFSLSFLPGLSLAFVVADKQLIESLSYLVSVRMMAVDWTSQKLLAKYLSDGSYYSILEAFRENYARKQELLCRGLDGMKELGISYNRPRGGVYIWCALPRGLDSKEFASAAYKRGLVLIPGYVFFPRKNGGREHIRINYSFETEERLKKGLEILRGTLEAGIGKSDGNVRQQSSQSTKTTGGGGLLAHEK